MKRYYLVLVLAIFTLSTYAQEISKSTYYLIRHAEKDRSDTTNRNPNLTKEGNQRAVKWSEVLNQFGMNAIYSTNYNRTMSTAQPTADANNLKIKSYHPSKINMDIFRKETTGKNVLVVGHSNTTAAFANKLIGSEVYAEIKDDNNANLYIVTIEGSKISHVLIKME
jgi:2,3-bisphosphoglycerate-dependent phosphoglycerate mutase